ncbi:tyrosine-type recombinase/integrase [Metabacillus halosaccharovorans]|uniref:tyrosine-type recombinase/integrase n=1 Tax=Metabacillus halosaccharovorans TaxID=930124 RepID=UPI00203F12E9|nr:site-specific integrase [Metabacillus halosaccharovorans]MCM3441424.1 site-specific integrase [Metabacillus halosaccharovorans]
MDNLFKNEFTLINNNKYQDLSLSNKRFIPLLIDNLLSDVYYTDMMDILDANVEGNFEVFNDLEMIYFYAHREKDLDERKNRNASTKKEYLRELVHFYFNMMNECKHFEFDNSHVDTNTLLKSLKPKNIRKYQEWLKITPKGKGNKPYSVATIARKVVILKSFLTFLYEKSYISVPLANVMLPAKVDENDRPDRDLNSTELIEILNYYKFHPILYCIFSLLATTGIRVRELCTSKMNDLSLENGDYWLSVMGKGNVRRDVLIHENIFKLIVEFRMRLGLLTELNNGDNSPIFTTNTGNAYSYKYLSNYISRTLSKCDLPIVKYRKSPLTAHHFRHCYAIISDEQGESIYRISKSLGHKSIQTTSIYLAKKLAREKSASHSWKNSAVINSIN